MMKPQGNVQAVFIDRDGTIGGTGHFIHPRDFRLYPNAQEAIMRLKREGIMVLALRINTESHVEKQVFRILKSNFASTDSITPIYVRMSKNAAAESLNLECYYMLQRNTAWIYPNA